MGKSTHPQQRPLDFHDDAQSLMGQAIDAVGTLRDKEKLIRLVVRYGIYENKDEMLAEFRAGQDPRREKFGDTETLDEFIEQYRQDWQDMLRLIENGKARNGAEARKMYYEGMDAISLLRSRTQGERTRVSSTLRHTNPR